MNILIADPIPLLNKGEQALLEGIIESLSSNFDNPKITLLSRNTNEDVNRSRVPVVDRSDVILSVIKKIKPSAAFFVEGIIMSILFRINRKTCQRLFSHSELWRAVFESDIIIVGHDSSVSYDAIVVGWILQKPMVIFAGSIELFQNKLKEIIATTLLSKVDVITLREEDSYKALDQMNIVTRVQTHVTADAAFLLKPCSKVQIIEINQMEGLRGFNRPIVGVTLTRQMCERSYSSISDTGQRYNKAIMDKAFVLDYLIDKYNVEVVFMPHCIGPGKNDDRLIAREVIKLMKNKDLVRAIESDYSASELKGLIGECEIFIGERTHSVIAALSQGIPSICMTFPSDRRTHGIIGGMVGKKEFIYNIESLNTNELCALIDRLWLNRKAIRSELEGIIPVVRERAFSTAGLIKKYLEKRKSN